MVSLSTCRCERTCRVAFLRWKRLVVLQHIDDLGLQAYQRQLLELFDTLLVRLFVGVRHGDAIAGGYRYLSSNLANHVYANHTRMVELP